MASDDTTVLPASMAPRAPAPKVPLLVASAVALAALSGAAWLHVQVGAVEQSLAAAEQRAADAANSAAAVRRELKAVQALLSERDGELAKLRDAPLPVDVAFRAGRPGTGFIAQIDNRSAEPLVVDVELARAATGERATVQLEIGAGGLGEIGPGNGWAFASGDTLRVSGGRYRGLMLRVP